MIDDKERTAKVWLPNVRFAVLTEPLILLYCMVQQRIADLLRRLAVVAYNDDGTIALTMKGSYEVVTSEGSVVTLARTATRFFSS